MIFVHGKINYHEYYKFFFVNIHSGSIYFSKNKIISAFQFSKLLGYKKIDLSFKNFKYSSSSSSFIFKTPISSTLS